MLRIRSRIYWNTRWARHNYVSAAPAIIIGGCVRSGTTLMRTMLDSHPNIAAGPESWLFVHPIAIDWLAEYYNLSLREVLAIRGESTCLAHFIELFFGHYARRMGKSRWAEKSPANVTRLKYIWRHFPRAKFIHMIRDARDVVCSIRSQRRRLHEDSAGRVNGVALDMDDGLSLWKTYVSAGASWCGDPRYLEVRYEDLVMSPREVMMRILDFVGEPWSDKVLHAHEHQLARRQKIAEIGTPEVHSPIFQTSIGRWRRDLSRAEIQRCWKKAGRLLEILGYAQ